MRRDTDGSTLIGSDIDWGHPARHGGRASARGSSGAALGLPGISRGSEEPVAGFPVREPFRHVRLSKDHGTLRQEPRCNERVAGGHMAGPLRIAPCRRHTGNVERLLQRQRHAMKLADRSPLRLLAVEGVGARPRCWNVHRDDRIDLGIQVLDDLEAILERLARGERARRDPPPGLGSAGPVETRGRAGRFNEIGHSACHRTCVAGAELSTSSPAGLPSERFSHPLPPAGRNAAGDRSAATQTIQAHRQAGRAIGPCGTREWLNAGSFPSSGAVSTARFGALPPLGDVGHTCRATVLGSSPIGTWRRDQPRRGPVRTRDPDR